MGLYLREARFFLVLVFSIDWSMMVAPPPPSSHRNKTNFLPPLVCESRLSLFLTCCCEGLSTVGTWRVEMRRFVASLLPVSSFRQGACQTVAYDIIGTCHALGWSAPPDTEHEEAVTLLQVKANIPLWTKSMRRRWLVVWDAIPRPLPWQRVHWLSAAMMR